MLAAVPAALAALFAIERTAPGDDAAQYWVMAGRLARTGDPFYVAAVDHKGPLWVWVYRLAHAVSGDQRVFWFVIASMAVVLGAITGLAVYRLVAGASGDRVVAAVAAAATTSLLWFGPEPYSQVLYSRNITIVLTAVAVVAVVRALDDPAGRAALALVPAGAALGLASTTVLTTIAPTVGLTVALAAVGVDRRRSIRRAGVLAASAAVGFAAVPAWYVARGAGGPFRTYFWDYNRLYASDDAPLLGRVAEAMVELTRHHLTHPYLLAGPVAVAVVARWATRAGLAAGGRSVRVGVVLAAWWFGEVVSVAAPGRWFGHYWVLLVVPSAALGGLVVASVRARPELDRPATRRPASIVSALGAVAVMVVLALSVPRASDGVHLAASFDGFAAHEAQRWETMSPGLSALRAATAALSAPGEPVYAWTPFAAIHVIVDRPAATRFDRRTWQTGEIWGSEVRADLPGVWDDLLDDLAVSRPGLIIEMLDEPIPAASALADLVARDYRPVFTVEPAYARLYVRTAIDDGAPPTMLAARDALVDGTTDCATIDADADGTIAFAWRGQTASFDIAADQVTMRSGEAANAAGSPVTAPRRGDTDLELRIGSTWVVLREGEQIVAAATLAHGVDAVTTTGQVVATSTPCLP